MYRMTIACTLLLAAMALELTAQRGKAPAPARPLELSVERVNDRRGGEFFQRLELAVEIPEFTSEEVLAARVLVRSAVDDSGQDLVDEEAGEPALEEVGGSSFLDEGSRKAPARLSFTLENPPRTSSTIKEVAGEIELFMPSRDPNTLALVPKFLGSKGKVLSHKALKANGVEIALISEQQLEAEKKKLAEAKRQELKKEGYSDDSIAYNIESFLEYFPKPEPDDVVVRIKDPRKVIHDISYVDSSGESKRVFTQDNEGLTFLSTWEGAPQADWGLRVSMKTSKNLVRRPFRLTEVPLP